MSQLNGIDYTKHRYGPEHVDTTAHRRLALSVAEQSMTLLKNSPVAAAVPSLARDEGGFEARAAGRDEQPLLPLHRSMRVALVGPQANFSLEMLSNYEGENKLVLTQSPLLAFRREFEHVIYAAGHSQDVSNPSEE